MRRSDKIAALEKELEWYKEECIVQQKKIAIMKTYTQLPMPKDSAWERKTWRRYTPIWFKTF